MKKNVKKIWSSPKIVKMSISDKTKAGTKPGSEHKDGTGRCHGGGGHCPS